MLVVYQWNGTVSAVPFPETSYTKIKNFILISDKSLW
jgi:hypothetical protein